MLGGRKAISTRLRHDGGPALSVELGMVVLAEPITHNPWRLTWGLIAQGLREWGESVCSRSDDAETGPYPCVLVRHHRAWSLWS